jgi:uncharacterized protein
LRFWDSSALIPLIVEEPLSAVVDGLLAEDREMTAWWATRVECASAVGRRERSGAMTNHEASYALGELAELTLGWSEISPGERLRDVATRLVRVHDLRAADAFQLAAASVASEGASESLPFVTLDDRLALAASREGFPVLPA